MNAVSDARLDELEQIVGMEFFNDAERAVVREVIAACRDARKNAVAWRDANTVPDYDQVVLALVGDDRNDTVIVQAYAEYDYALYTGASVTWFTAADHIRIREEILAWAPLPALPDGCAVTPRPSHLRR